MTRRSLRLVPLVLALLVAGCGAEPTPPPDTTTPAVPRGASPRSFPSSGVSFTTPANWAVASRTAPEVAQVSSASSAIGIFRYPRQERLPRSSSDLDQAADRIVEAARARDSSYQQTSRAPIRVGGLPAVRVDGTGSIIGRPVTIRSVHVYGRGGEVVVEAVASRADFARVVNTVVAPILRSMRLTRPRT